MTIRATATFTPRSTAGRFIDAVVTPAVEAGVSEVASRILGTAQLIAPEDTGDLRDSGRIEIERTDKTVQAQIVFDSDHAAYVEFGTGRRGAASPGAGPYPYSPTWPGMVAQPYLRPALDEERGNATSSMAGQLSARLRT